jgi:TolB-like protein
LSLDSITSRISDGILAELTQSNKFAVVNRAFDKQFDKERKLLASDKVSPAEASRLGRKLGADFIVLGKIHELNFKRDDKEYYGIVSKKIESNINLFYVVVEAATEKVLWADTVSYEYESIEEERAVSEFVNKLSSSIVTNILDITYPIKIMKLAGEKNILLNQGGKRLAKGQIMEVFTTGESIMDPDTGMPIKIDGEKVAELEVTAVKPKYSVTKFIKGSGNYRDLSVNAITRRAITTKKSMPAHELTPGSSDQPVKW